MGALVIPRWPFRLAVTSTVILFGGLSTLLITLGDLTSDARYRALHWQYTILKVIPFLAAILALTSLWVGIRSLLKQTHARTFWNYSLLGFASLTLILVIAMASNWALIESALWAFTEDGGWAAFRSHPTATEVVGRVISPNGSIQSYPDIDRSNNLRTASVTAANGCFFVTGPAATNFGVFSPGYQKLDAPMGNGYFRVSASLSPMSASEPSKVTLQKISLLALIRERNACDIELHLSN
jgi:hypothetical protein